jgi:hypothetical protein
MKIGDTVECIDSNHVSIGVVGVITGFHKNGRAFIMSDSGYKWMIRVDRLRRVNEKHSQKLTRKRG